MRTFFRLVELETGSSRDNFLLVIEIVIQNLLEIERFGLCTVFHQRKENDTVRGLKLSLFIESIQNDLRIRISLDFDNDTHTISARFVTNIRDSFNLLIVYHVRNRLNELCFVDLVRDFRNDDAGTNVAARAIFLNFALGTDNDVTLPRSVRFLDAAPAHNDTARGEVGSGNDFHKLVHRDVGVVNHCNRTVDNLRKVMRRNVRRHTDSDTVRTVYKEVGVSCREYGGFFFRCVEVGNEVHRFLVEVFEHFRRKLGELCFRITHSRRRVTVDRTEVTVAVYKGEVDGEVLRKTYECIINGTVAVRVIFTHTVTDDTGALSRRLIVVKPHFVHGEKDTSVNGFQTVTNVRDRTGFVYRHCIRNEGAFELVVHFYVEQLRHRKCFLKFLG